MHGARSAQSGNAITDYPIIYAARNPRLVAAYALPLGLCLTALILAQIALSVGPVEALAVPVGLIACGCVLVRPFFGVFLLVFLAQLLGLVIAMLGGIGEYVYEGLTVLTLVAVVLQARQRPEAIRWGGNTVVFRLAAVFFLTTFLSTLFSEFPDSSWEAFFKLCSLLIVLFVVVVETNTKGRLLALIAAVMAATAISGSLSVLGYLGGGALIGDAEKARLVGASSTDATTTANVMLIGTMLGLIMLFRLPKLRKLGALSAVFGICGVVLSYSRSAMMFLVVGGGVLTFILRKSRYAPAGMLLGLLVVISLLPAVPDRVWDRFSHMANPSQDWTLGRRWGYHVIGVELLMEHPVLGVGPGAFAHHYADFDFRWEEGRRQETRELHNIYLGTAVQHGLVGFVLFAGMLVAAMYGLEQVRRRTRDPTLAVVAQGMQLAFGVFLLSIATLPALSNKMFWIVLALSTAVHNVSKRLESGEL